MKDMYVNHTHTAYAQRDFCFCDRALLCSTTYKTTVSIS